MEGTLPGGPAPGPDILRATTQTIVLPGLGCTAHVFAELAPGLTDRFEGAGHYVFLDRRDGVLEVMRQFLDRHAGAGEPVDARRGVPGRT